MSKNNETNRSTTVYNTKDYDQFKTIKGNRSVDPAHVQELVKSITERGNLTPDLPIVVNKNYEIIDGQHRFEALKELQLPIYYEIKDNLNIEEVRLINSHHRNWSWRDYAESYAALGNEHYKAFLKLWNEREVPMGFTTMLMFTNHASTARLGGKAMLNFNQGGFTITDLEKTRAELHQFAQLAIAANHNTRNFAVAALKIMRRPKYSQTIMESRLGSHSEAVSRCYYVEDYLIALERVYRGAV